MQRWGVATSRSVHLCCQALPDFVAKDRISQHCAPALCGCSSVTAASLRTPARLADAFMLLLCVAAQHHLQLGFLCACKLVKKGSKTPAPALCSCADLCPLPRLPSGVPPTLLMLPLCACLEALNNAVP